MNIFQQYDCKKIKMLILTFYQIFQRKVVIMSRYVRDSTLHFSVSTNYCAD